MYEFKENKLQLDKVISIGTAVNLEIKRYDQDTVIDLKTMIQDIAADNIITVNRPRQAGSSMLLSEGVDIKVIVLEGSVGQYIFYAKCIGKIDYDGIPCVKLKPISEIEKFQRRKYFRLSFIGQINIDINDLPEDMAGYVNDPRVKFKIKNDTLDDNTVSRYIVVDGRDISGGGLRASCRMPLPINQEVYGKVFLEDEIVSFKGIVVRCNAVVNELGNYEIGISFVDMDEEKRSKIIAFIFDKQRRMMKKG